jgi:hypothetical protein
MLLRWHFDLSPLERLLALSIIREYSPQAHRLVIATNTCTVHAIALCRTTYLPASTTLQTLALP